MVSSPDQPDRLAQHLARMREVRAPEAVRQRILAAVRAEDRGPTGRRSWRRWTAVGLAAAAVLVATVLAPNRGSRAAAALATMAKLEIEATERLGSADAYDMQMWLEESVGYAVDIPDIGNAVLVGARVSEVDGVRVATVVYLSRGMPVTYFALPTDEIAGFALRTRLRSMQTNGYTVAMWADRGQARVVAAPLPLAEVRQIAEECRAKMALN